MAKTPTKKADLEELMKEAGVDDKTKAKMHEVNNKKNQQIDDASKKPVAHGAASPHHAVIDEI